jgi:pyruvate carboxylase
VGHFYFGAVGQFSIGGDNCRRRPARRWEKGAPLLVLEPMKMEHTISAARKGVVKAFRVERVRCRATIRAGML